MQNPTSNAAATAPHPALAGLIFLALAACGGGSGDSGGNPGGGPGGGTMETISLADDVFIGVGGADVAELAVLENDTLAESLACVTPSKVGGLVTVDTESNNIQYLAPHGFVGTDTLSYVAEDAMGNRRMADVTVRVDDYLPVEPRNVSAETTKTAALGPAMAATGDDLEFPMLVSVNELVRIEPVPKGRGRSNQHQIQAVLERGAAYRISIEYNTREDLTGAYWSQYPLATLKDRNSANITDACVFVDNVVRTGYLCGWYSVNGRIEIDYTPRETQTHNLYIGSDIFDPYDTPNALTCDQISNSDIYGHVGCGYDLLIEETDDNRGTTMTREAIGGTPNHGNIERAADSDWFRLTVYPSEHTFIDVIGEENWKGDSLTSFNVYLHNGRGDIIASYGSVNGQASFDYLANSPETLYVSVNWRGDTGGYRIEESGGDVPGGTDTYAELALGESKTGRLSASRDADWYRVYLNADEPVNVRVDSLQSEVPATTIAIFDARGTQMFGLRDDPSDSRCLIECTVQHDLTFRPSKPGVYFVSVGALRVTGEDGAAYELIVDEAPGPAPTDDHGDDDLTQSYAGSYYPMPGMIEQIDDEDWFSFYANRGDKRIFYVEGASADAGTLQNISADIVSRDGVVLANGSTWDSGGQIIEFTPEIASDFFLKVSGSGGSTGSYVILSEVGDPAASPDTWAYLGAGGSAVGNLDTVSDGDWYRISLVSDLAYDIKVAGTDEGLGALAEPQIRLYSATGDQVQSAAPAGSTVGMTINNVPTGDYYLAVNSSASQASGGYTISATQQGADNCSL